MVQYVVLVWLLHCAIRLTDYQTSPSLWESAVIFRLFVEIRKGTNDVGNLWGTIFRCGPGYHCADLYQYSVLFTFINDQTCWVGITLYNPVPLSLQLNTPRETRKFIFCLHYKKRWAELTDSCYFLHIHRGIPSLIQYLFVRFVLSLNKYADTNVCMRSCVTVALTSISTEGCECVTFRSPCHWTDCVSIQVALNLYVIKL